MSIGPRAHRRVTGSAQCCYNIVSATQRGHYLTPKNMSGARLKGARCQEMVGPVRRKRLGIAVCHCHEEMYLADVAEDAARRRAWRAKFDPGPLPNSGE